MKSRPAVRARSDATRARIVAAARDLFAEQGFEATTVRDIAARSLLTDPALYYYFNSKREIMWAVIQEAPLPEGARVPVARTPADVAAFVRHNFRFWMANLPAVRTILCEALAGDEVATRRSLEMRRDIEANMNRQLEVLYGDHGGVVALALEVLGAGLFVGSLTRSTRTAGALTDGFATRARLDALITAGCPLPQDAAWAGTVSLPPRRPSPATAEPAPMSPAQATRRRILEASLELFAERGFEGTTVRAIAARCGLTDPALYYHFRSKAELLASLEELAGPVRLSPAPDGPLTLAWLAALVDDLLEEVRHDTAGLRLAFRSLLVKDARPVAARYLTGQVWWHGVLRSCRETYAPGEAEARADILAAVRLGLGQILALNPGGRREAESQQVRDAMIRAVAALVPLRAPATES